MERLKVSAAGGISRTFGFLSFPFLFGQRTRIFDKGVMGVVVGCDVVTVEQLLRYSKR
jgi:hypothetical protein